MRQIYSYHSKFAISTNKWLTNPKTSHICDRREYFKHENTSSHKLNSRIKLLFAKIEHYNKNIDLFFPLSTSFP
jgi:hypothetical protein